MTDPVMLLSQVHGEGRVTFRALTSAGFDTLGAIAGTQVQVLADRAHLSTGTAQRLKQGALEMIGDGADSRAGRASRPSPARRAAKVAGRKSARETGGPTGSVPRNPGGPMFFSAGIDDEEAALLGQGVPAAPRVAPEVSPVPPDPPVSPVSNEAPHERSAHSADVPGGARPAAGYAGQSAASHSTAPEAAAVATGFAAAGSSAAIDDRSSPEAARVDAAAGLVSIAAAEPPRRVETHLVEDFPTVATASSPEAASAQPERAAKPDATEGRPRRASFWRFG